MIAKTVRKGPLRTLSEIREELAYWLSRSPEERISAVELLRKQQHGSAERLQRTARVLKMRKVRQKKGHAKL